MVIRKSQVYLDDDGALPLPEITTPTPEDSVGKIYFKSDNQLYGQDGEGIEHIMHGDAFSSLWYHGAEATTTIDTVNVPKKIVHFVNTGPEDDMGNAVADPVTDDDITISDPGTYQFHIGASFKNASGANKNLVIVVKIILASAKTITDASNTDPIVVTSEGHGLKSGDGVAISGVGGNAAAIGNFVITRLTADTFSLQTFAHGDVAGTGEYTSGGTVDAIFCGEAIVEGVVSGNDLERGFGFGKLAMASGDIAELYVVNTSDNNNAIFSHIVMSVERVGD